MNNAERIHKLIIEKKLLDGAATLHASGVRDIDIAFDMIDEPSSDILTLNERKGV